MTYWQSAGGTRDAGAGDDDPRDRVFPDLTGQPTPARETADTAPRDLLLPLQSQRVAGELSHELPLHRGLSPWVRRGRSCCQRAKAAVENESQV